MAEQGCHEELCWYEMVPFAERLRKARNRKKLTQVQIVEQLGIPYRTYQNYEGGKRRPSFEMLVVLADYFGVTTDYLLGRTDE